MKLNREHFSKVCAEVISDITSDEEIPSSNKVMVLLIGTIISGKIANKLFSDDEEIEIVSNSSGCEDK